MASVLRGALEVARALHEGSGSSVLVGCASDITGMRERECGQQRKSLRSLIALESGR